MKLLVVNADDLGAGLGRNRGIFKGVQDGVVTSVSLLPNGPATLSAIEWLKSAAPPSLSVGVHLNLSEGAPLVPGHKKIVGGDGFFLTKWRAHELFTNEADEEVASEVAAEIDAQVKFFFDVGLTPDHLDGHQHIHIFPGILDLAIDACERYGIAWFRLPTGQPSSGLTQVAGQTKMAGTEGAELFSRMATKASGRVAAAQLSTVDSFRGLNLIDRITCEALLEVVEQLSHTITELMVHPGFAEPAGVATPFSPFSTGERQSELAALLDDNFRRLVGERGVELSGFPKIKLY